MNSPIVFSLCILFAQITCIRCSPLEKEGWNKEFDNENSMTYEEEKDLNINRWKRQAFEIDYPLCNSSQCQCHLNEDRFGPTIFLGCFAREDIICPAIDGADIFLECGDEFCLCNVKELILDEITFHCFEPNIFHDCPTTTPPPTTSTTTTTTTTMPPATPTPTPIPEDDCPDY